MRSILSVKNLTKTFFSKPLFGKREIFTAVNNISFELREGEILGLLGPNGAGKTTTMQMLLGLLTPTSGSIYYFGKNLVQNRSEIIEQISFVSAYLKLPGSLTVQENLKLYSLLYNVPSPVRNERIAKNLAQFDLQEIKDRLTKNLSSGQCTRLMFAKAFLSNPKVILLDEPTAALDPDIARQVRQFIITQSKHLGVSIVLTSHNMSEVEEICDRVIVMKSGHIIATDTPQKLISVVKTTKLNLLVTHIDQAIQYAHSKKIPFTVDGQYIALEIDEQKIPDLLFDIMHSGVKYLEISIEKPTLEDYFLSIATQKNSL